MPLCNKTTIKFFHLSGSGVGNGDQENQNEGETHKRKDISLWLSYDQCPSNSILSKGTVKKSDEKISHIKEFRLHYKLYRVGLFLAIKKNIHNTTLYVRYLQKHLLSGNGKDHEACQPKHDGATSPEKMPHLWGLGINCNHVFSYSPELCLLLRYSPSSSRRQTLPLFPSLD